MPRYKMFSLTNSVPGRDEEFNTWYSDTHVHDLVKVPGVISAQRYQMVLGGQWQYFTLYDVETDDVEGVWEEIYRRAGSGEIFMSDSWAPEHYAGIAKPIGEMAFAALNEDPSHAGASGME